MRWQQVETEIRKVALELYEAGLFPSLRRVSSRITQTLVAKRTCNLLRAIRDELGLQGTEQTLNSYRLEP